MISLERRVALLLGIILFVSYAYFFQGGGWNPNSRLDLTRAWVEQHTLAIDDYVGNTGDWAYFNGHYYANKAPAQSFQQSGRIFIPRSRGKCCAAAPFLGALWFPAATGLVPARSKT